MLINFKPHNYWYKAYILLLFKAYLCAELLNLSHNVKMKRVHPLFLRVKSRFSQYRNLFRFNKSFHKSLIYIHLNKILFARKNLTFSVLKFHQ